MKRLIPLAVLGMLLLGGCAQRWTHPSIAGPREEDRKFEEHSALCTEEAARVPEAQRQALYEDCLTRLGWEKKD